MLSIGNRKAFASAAIGYLCIGGFIGIGVAFYGAVWDKWLDIACVLAVVVGYLVIAPIALIHAWRQASNGQPIQPIYLVHLFPQRLRRWMTGRSVGE